VSPPTITRVKAIEVRCVERAWPWADENEAAIAAFWAKATADKPRMFDGPVFLFADVHVENGTLRGVCFESRFSRLLYLKRHGFPDPDVVNGFAMGALRAADGAYLLGVMGPHTSTAGQIYFPAGTPDPADRGADGMLDLRGSVVREIAEETGLTLRDYEIGDDWVLVSDGGLLAFMPLVRLAEPADRARSLMLERMSELGDEELSDIYIARGLDDIDERRMPRYMQAFLRWAFVQDARAPESLGAPQAS
jgi:8-oxo-dGTP pyrophosphatase MutT (NUDIX family)